MEQPVPKHIAHMLKWESVLAYIFRGVYALMTVSMFTRLSDPSFEVSSSVNEILFNVIIFLMCFAILLPMVLAGWIIEIEKNVIKEARAKGIHYPRLYIPIVVYGLYLATMWIEFFIPLFRWIFLIISVVVTEWYFYQKRRAIKQFLEIRQG